MVTSIVLCNYKDYSLAMGCSYIAPVSSVIYCTCTFVYKVQLAMQVTFAFLQGSATSSYVSDTVF